MAAKVLVLGTDSRILLSVTRSLGRGGLQVHAAANTFEHAPLQSRYLRRSHFLPDFHESDVQWKHALLALMRREQFDLVIPCTELEIIACQRHRHELEQFGKVYLLNDRAFDILFDKFKTIELARSVGVRTPREIIVSEASQVPEILAQFGLPVVLKPARSLDLVHPGPLHKVRKAYDEGELRRLLSRMLVTGPVAVQENFIGTGVGVDLLLDAGMPLLAFQHCRVHEPLHGGPSSYRRSLPLAMKLLAAALKILKPLAYTGVAMVEFKVNEPRGTWVFLEVNARFWGSLPLAVAAGADFPLALFQFLVQGQTNFNPHYRTDIFCRNWSMDWDWQRSNFSADRSDATLASRPLGTVLKDACFNLLTGRERSDTLTLDDPRPGLAELHALARRLGARLWRPLRWRTPGQRQIPLSGLIPRKA